MHITCRSLSRLVMHPFTESSGILPTAAIAHQGAKDLTHHTHWTPFGWCAFDIACSEGLSFSATGREVKLMYSTQLCQDFYRCVLSSDFYRCVLSCDLATSVGCRIARQVHQICYKRTL